MTIDPAIGEALDRIAARATDARAAFTAGAFPIHGDAATERAESRPTIDPLSAVAPDGDYFVVVRNGLQCYTRDGSFTLAGGTLVSSDGTPVLGYAGARGPLGELRVDPVDAALGRVEGARIEADGTVAYLRSALDPRTGARATDRVVVGRLALARFPAATKLVRVDASRAAAPQGAQPHLGCPQDGAFGPVEPMRREASRIDIDRSLARLREAYVALDALQAAHRARGHLSKTAMDLVK